MSAGLEGFREHLERTESPRTVLAYFADGAAFEAFRAGRPAGIDLYEAWADSVNHGRCRPKTFARKKAGVNRWLAFLARHGDQEAARTLAILHGGYKVGPQVRPADRKRVEPVTPEEYRDAGARAPAWGRALMALLWWAGPRISEVVGDPLAGIPALTVADGRALASEGCTVTRGKGGKVRTLVLPAAIRGELASWLDGREPDSPLFPSPSNPGRPVTPQSVNAMLHQAGLRCGAHAFRHAYKARLRRAGVAEEVIRALMGHGPRSVTDNYGEPTIVELLAAVERLADSQEVDRT